MQSVSSPGRRRWVVIAVVAVLLLFLLFSNEAGSRGSKRIIASLKSSFHVEVPPGYLHVLIPADHKDVNLCKTVVSAAVTDFSTPTLINWGESFKNPKLVGNGSHLAKISGVLAYLQKLGRERDDDLVLIVDGYDVWFQLRPSMLIARYYAINEAANARIRKAMGSRAMDAEKIEQTIVFSAQKRCWPWKADDPACYAIPEWSLPADAYGPETDVDIGFKKNPYVKFRQRYLNSGNVMGRVGSMRTLYQRAMHKAEKDANFGSDQKILSEIFGDQEFQREVMRERHQSSWQRFSGWATGKRSILDSHSTRHPRERRKGQPDEFGIGLDYASLIGHPTVFCEEDSEWLRHSDAEHITKASADRGVDPPRIKELATDVSESQPPFLTMVPTGQHAEDQMWREVPLYSNVWTSVVPGLIHHNAHRDGLKKLRKTAWDRMWYFEGLRWLYNSTVAGPSGPVAVVDDASGKRQAWWSPTRNKGGAESDKGKWLSWAHLCGEYEGELFRDGGE
ncbi:hypothetical protein EJ04DRAFT_163919 [Polyplosphaeria fusca]|uniref:Uncharacterized protein n=1 Tax=Polyplosphaeria fusca TaxID=682080 RepID=A0A9P4R801_9PLEO|nr:hypothetical protein EJ04DRAFT_163919 [Polyplosphaeria fusca]